MTDDILKILFFFLLGLYFFLFFIFLLTDLSFRYWIEEKIHKIKMKRFRKKQEKNAKMWEEFYNNLNKKR